MESNIQKTIVHASNVSLFMVELIRKVANGASDQYIESSLMDAIHHFEQLKMSLNYKEQLLAKHKEIEYMPVHQPMKNKWEAKEVGEESYAITDGKISIVTSDAENDQYLQAIADLFNSSGYRFHSENKLELDLHLEAEAAKMELIDVKAKCERYETALVEIKKKANYGWPKDLAVGTKSGTACIQIYNIVDEALSAGEGEKEVELEPRNWNEYFENQKDDEE